MAARIRNIQDVAAMHLCCGCGACAYLSPGQIDMVDAVEFGRRPRFRGAAQPNADSQAALGACPGVGLKHTFDRRAPGLIQELVAAWGPVLELWEGYAADPEIRFAGSSGGAASAIALYAIERGGMHGVLHIAAREDVPYLNRTVLSRSRVELLERTGSRYAPASPCDGLALIEEAPAPCVFIGKPCDVAGARMACRLRPRLERRLGVTIAFFCAGTPSTRGTLAMIEKMGIPDPSRVLGVRYRGKGWPGQATVRFRNECGAEEERSLTYEQSWGEILEVHRQWRCHVCADHTGEFADIAVGDPWYRPITPGDPGRSLILARTELGRRILAEAMAAGYLQMERAGPEKLPASQRHFEAGRGSVWGRILMLRLLGAAAPRYEGLPLFRFWWSRLDWKKKLKSTLGTARRIFRKKLLRRAVIEPFNPTALPAATEKA